MKKNNSEIAIMESRIYSLNQQLQRIEDEKDKLKELKDEFAGFYAPFRAGAIIDIPDKAYVHKGKKGKVEECCLRHSTWGNCWKWFVYGVVLKKDGTEAMQRFKYETEVELL